MRQKIIKQGNVKKLTENEKLRVTRKSEEDGGGGRKTPAVVLISKK